MKTKGTLFIASISWTYFDQKTEQSTKDNFLFKVEAKDLEQARKMVNDVIPTIVDSWDTMIINVKALDDLLTLFEKKA